MDRLKLTGLWQNRDRNGQIYYAGSVNPGIRLMVFKNNRKQKEKDPDLVAYLVPAERREDARPDS